MFLSISRTGDNRGIVECFACLSSRFRLCRERQLLRLWNPAEAIADAINSGSHHPEFKMLAR